MRKGWKEENWGEREKKFRENKSQRETKDSKSKEKMESLICECDMTHYILMERMRVGSWHTLSSISTYEWVTNFTHMNESRTSHIWMTHDILMERIDRKNPPPPGGFPLYYVPSSRTVIKRTPLETPGTNFSRGVLILAVLDEGT